MGQVSRFVRVVGLVVCIQLTVSGQAMLEHAVTAAGGSAAGIAGKSVSDGLDKVFEKLSKQMGTAAATGQVEATRKVPVTLEQRLPGVGPTASAGRTSRSSSSAVAARRGGTQSPADASGVAWSGASFGAMQPEPTRDDLSQIEDGVERTTVVAQLGRPAVRIFIPEEGALREVYYFSGAGEHLGTVELSDGVVQAVNIR